MVFTHTHLICVISPWTSWLRSMWCTSTAPSSSARPEREPCSDNTCTRRSRNYRNTEWTEVTHTSTELLDTFMF